MLTSLCLKTLLLSSIALNAHSGGDSSARIESSVMQTASTIKASEETQNVEYERLITAKPSTQIEKTNNTKEPSGSNTEDPITSIEQTSSHSDPIHATQQVSDLETPSIDSSTCLLYTSPSPRDS